MRFNLLAMALVAGLVSAGSAVRADVLTIDFKTVDGQSKVATLNPAGTNWDVNGSAGVAAFFGGTSNTALTLTTINGAGGIFRATNEGATISLVHSFGFDLDGSSNPKDYGYMQYALAGTSGWNTISTNVSGPNYTTFNPGTGSVTGFSNTSANPIVTGTSVFSFATVAGQDYQFRYIADISGAGDLSGGAAWNLSQMTVSAVPEPGTLMLAGISAIIGGAGLARRRKRTAKLNNESEAAPVVAV